MTNDEILAALENARMDLERACQTLSDAGLLDAARQVYNVKVYLSLAEMPRFFKRENNDDPVN